MKVINLMVGGPADMIPPQSALVAQVGKWIGVDYGATYLLKQGIVPVMALGDFDSTSATELATLKQKVADVRIFENKTEHTDTQLGVLAALREFQPDQINIYGATGGRLDQLLANLFLPLQAAYRPYLRRLNFIDKENHVSFYGPGNYAIQKRAEMRYLSFVNLVPCTGLNLPDEKYPLHDFDSQIPFCWSSNEFNGPVNHFSLKTGIVAVIQSVDQQHGND